MTTLKTAFGRGVELVNLDEGSSVPPGFVFQLTDKFSPSDITDGFSKAVVLYHILDLQTLHAYDLVLAYEFCGKFVLRVSSSIADTCVYLCYLTTGFVPVLGAFFLFRLPTLGLCQFLLIFGKELGIAVGLPITGNHHRLQAQVKPYLLLDHRKRLDVLFYEQRDKIASCRVFGDGHSSGLSTIRQGATPYDVEGLCHLRKHECLSIPFESRTGIGSGLFSMLLVELGILGTPLKEVAEGAVQVSQGLLRGDRRDLTEPYMLLLLLESSQALCGSLIGQALSILIVGIGALSKRPIIDVATTPEGTGKKMGLLFSWREPVFVRSLLLPGFSYQRTVL